MGLESVSSQLSLQSTAPNRADAANAQFKESVALRERQDATKASSTAPARSQKTETRDYRNSEQLLASQQSRDDSLTDTRGGGKRGGVLDISV